MSSTFEAPVVLEFVKTYISDGQDPHLWIAGANDLPVPPDSQGFKVPEDDIQLFYGLNIVGEPAMLAEYNKFKLDRLAQVVTEDPYRAIPSPTVEVEEQQPSTGGKAQVVSEELKSEEQLAYEQWLEQALKSGEFDYIGHDKSVYNRLFSPSLATVLSNYEKLGGGDPEVDSLKQRIAHADLTTINTEYIYQGSRIWTRTGERLVGELQQALNKFYHSKQMKLLKYDLRNLEKGAASFKKLPQPGSSLWDSFINRVSNGEQTHLEARLHKLKAEARGAQPATGSYFKRQRNPRIQQLAAKLGLD